MFPAMLPNPEIWIPLAFPPATFISPLSMMPLALPPATLAIPPSWKPEAWRPVIAGKAGDLETRHIVLYNTGYSVDTDSFQLIDICKQTDIQISGFDTVFLRGNSSRRCWGLF